ncbi:STAS domain-containing protein [candidate division KSB1 bacterium]
MDNNKLDFSVTEHNDVCVITIQSEKFDSTKAPQFKTEILRVIASGFKYAVVDLFKVKLIDSSGLGALTFGKRQFSETSGNLTICSVQKKVLTLFSISKLDRVFDIHETLEESLEKIKGQA